MFKTLSKKTGKGVRVLGLTDKEIITRIAEFMGWNSARVYNGKDWVFLSHRDPLTDISDAFEVVEKLKEKNILLNINTWNDAIEVMRVGSTKPNPYFYIFDIHPLSRAICEVAIKVIDEK